jgi:phosphate-selective porin OprO/OprP
VPRSFRLATNASNAGTADRAAPPFLIFNDGVIERGQRTFWSAHVAYFYRSLSVVADYNGSIQRFALNRRALDSAVVPVDGFAVSVGYFLTGEEIERRTIVEPLRPFKLKRGEFGLGAVELIGRYSTFDADDEVFDAGLADRDLWSNRAWVTNLGINWYPNKFVKVYIDWQHGEFGDPVFYAGPDLKALTNEMLWLRCQFYY